MLHGKAVIVLLAVVMAVALTVEANAQNAARTAPTREEMQQRMEQRLKETLGVTAEEWAALKPKVDKVQALVRQLRAAQFGFGRRPGEAAPADQSELEKKMTALRTLLQNKDAKAEDITAALDAYREARAKVKADLEKAQKELLEVVTPRQEAGLVTLGLLD